MSIPAPETSAQEESDQQSDAQYDKNLGNAEATDQVALETGAPISLQNSVAILGQPGRPVKALARNLP